MKKVLATLLTLVLSLSLLTACGADKPQAPSAAPSGNGAASSGEKLPGEGMRIALVCDKVGTQIFMVQMVNALNEAAEKYGFTPTVVECGDSAQYEDNIRALAMEECDLIIGGGWPAGDAINKIATEMPDAAHYALIDAAVDAENVKCISFRDQEGAYLVGMLAAMTMDGETDTYGAVHVNEGPGSWKYRFGYMSGVKAVDPDAKFIFNYVGSYTDPAKAKELALQQYAQGCGFINSAAAGGDSGTFEAAKEKKFYTSGQDIDLTDPSNPYIVTSQIKNSYQTVWNIIDEYFSGNWSTGKVAWGIKEGVSGAVHVTCESLNPRNERLSDEEIAQAKQALEDIRSGKINLIDLPTEEEYNANN